MKLLHTLFCERAGYDGGRMKRRKINKIVNGNYISQRWLSKGGNARVCHNIVDGTGESLTKRGERRGRLYISFRGSPSRRGPAVQRLKLGVVVENTAAVAV